MEWGQTVVKEDLRLVVGKPALLRAYVLGDKAGLSAKVRASVYLNGQFRQDLDLTGPATFPTAENVSDLSQSFRATLPASLVQPGLEVRLQADPDNQIVETDETNNLRTVTPTVGKETTLYLTLVPVIRGGTQPPTPDLGTLKQGLVDIWPLKAVDMQTRAAYSTNTTDWGQLLNEVTALRTADKSGRYYYGYLNLGGGIAWLGLPVGVGNPSSGVMAHELGHNFTLSHAPCGNAPNPDPNYPYAGGGIGSWGYNLSKGALVDPADSKIKDVMGYCGFGWVSDYMYQKAQTFLEASPPQAQTEPQLQNVLLVSGRVTAQGVVLDPPTPMQAPLSLPKPGPYTLRLQTEKGVREVPFATYTAIVMPNHDEHTGHFQAMPAFTPQTLEQFVFSVSDPGALKALEVRRGGASLARLEAGVKLQTAPNLQLREEGESLFLSWNSAAYRHLSVAHLEAQRTTLALWQEGGSVRVSTRGLPAGGVFEVVLSDGINTLRQEIKR
ncbi:MAG TPA: M66 family metalloprotease [Meiothermus sp.]|nr:M66 family metalloprotease [Meiothermus sp.]